MTAAIMNLFLLLAGTDYCIQIGEDVFCWSCLALTK